MVSRWSWIVDVQGLGPGNALFHQIALHVKLLSGSRRARGGQKFRELLDHHVAAQYLVHYKNITDSISLGILRSLEKENNPLPVVALAKWPGGTYDLQTD